jgi:hypothetical protein
MIEGASESHEAARMSVSVELRAKERRSESDE